MLTELAETTDVIRDKITTFRRKKNNKQPDSLHTPVSFQTQSTKHVCILLQLSQLLEKRILTLYDTCEESCENVRNQCESTNDVLIVSLCTNKNSKHVLFPSGSGNGDTYMQFKKTHFELTQCLNANFTVASMYSMDTLQVVPSKMKH